MNVRNWKRAAIALRFAAALIAAGAVSAAAVAAPPPARIAALTAPSCQDKDVLAWRTAVLAASGAVSGKQLAAECTLVTGLKTDGTWPSIDRLWTYAAESSTQALIDLVARASATAVNSPTFTAARGFAGNGTSAYINSGYNASTAGGAYTLNAASFGCWIVIAEGSSGLPKYFLGNANTSGHRSFLRKGGTTAYEYGINYSGSATTFAQSSDTGLWMVQRTASSAMFLWQNGVKVQTGGTSSSEGPDNANLFSLATNDGAGTAVSPTTAQLALCFAGGSLAGKEAAFYGRIRTYMTAMGVP